MRFRRHRRRFKTPTLWARAAFTSQMTKSGVLTSQIPSNSQVVSIDVLATGVVPGVIQQALDEQWTVRRIKLDAKMLIFNSAAIDTDISGQLWIWCIIAKVGSNQISRYIAGPTIATLGLLINGGVADYPAAADVLAYRHMTVSDEDYLSNQSQLSKRMGESYIRSEFKFDIKSQRRLQTDESICAFWGFEWSPPGQVTGSGFSATIRWYALNSVLYSRTPAKR